MSEQDRTEQAPGVAATLRQLADFVDAHPALEQFPEIFGIEPTYFGHHWRGADAAKLDAFAQAFGVEVQHAAPFKGTRYSHIRAEIDGIEFRPQAYTEDYEKATGKTVAVPLTPEQLAEVKHWSETPFAHETREDGVQ